MAGDDIAPSHPVPTQYPPSPMYMDTLDRKDWLKLMSVFLGIFFIFLIVSFTGPAKAWDETVNTANQCPPDVVEYNPADCHGSNFKAGEIHTEELVSVNRDNLFLVVRLQFLNKEYQKIGVRKHVRYQIDVYHSDEDRPNSYIDSEVSREHGIDVYCPEGEMYCKGTTVMREFDLKHKSYMLQIQLLTPEVELWWYRDAQFHILYQKKIYMQYNMAFHYMYFCFSVITGAYWVYLLNKETKLKRPLETEQRQVSGLVITTLWLNNPFFAGVYTESGAFFSYLNQFFTLCFLAYTLYFWLAMPDLYAVVEFRKRSSFSFYFPKVLLCFLIWLLSMIRDSERIDKASDDPSFRREEDQPDAALLRSMQLACMLLWLFWFLMHLFLKWSTIRLLNDVRAFRYKVFFTGACVMVLFVFLEVVLGISSSGRYSFAEALLFYTMFNLYTIWNMTIYAPSRRTNLREARLRSLEEGQHMIPSNFQSS
eukprot:GFYU01004068.1.p1 GENE.GFYU01004068.1~~GFYU01004068.1.p1  ORF type:complete len:480 (-),score=107.12 GFYU01004068.1:68-1507(-)